MLRLTFVFSALFFIQFSSTASAQSSLFNIPTADVLSNGETYLEADFDVHFARNRNGGWQSYGFFGVYGTGKKSEIGLNAYVVRSENGFEPVELQPNFKYQVYNNETSGVSVSTGAIGYLPLTKRFGRDASASVYAVAAKQFNGRRAPRFTGGGYQMLGAGKDEESTRGFLLGVEQPINSRVTLIADWNSGKNRLGYAAAGIGIAPTKRSYLSSAYYFGNEGRGNNFLGIYYGFSF